jgi:hypothetical protein
LCPAINRAPGGRCAVGSYCDFVNENCRYGYKQDASAMMVDWVQQIGRAAGGQAGHFSTACSHTGVTANYITLLMTGGCCRAEAK